MGSGPRASGLLGFVGFWVEVVGGRLLGFRVYRAFDLELRV